MVAEFGEEVRRINKQIDSYNLSVPASWMSVHRLNQPSELERALHEAPQRWKELKAERKSRLKPMCISKHVHDDDRMLLHLLMLEHPTTGAAHMVTINSLEQFFIDLLQTWWTRLGANYLGQVR